MRANVSALDFIVISCYIIIFGFLWRALAIRWADKPIGKAMAVIF